MKRCPERLGHGFYISAERRYDSRKRVEGGLQFWSGASFGELQIRRQDEHGLVECRTTEPKGEIGHGDILEGISSSGRFACRFPKSQRDVLETLDCNCRDNRIPVLEMRIEDWLTVFDFFGQATDCNGTPSVPLRDRARCRDNAMLALSPLPAFPLGDTQSAISQTCTAHIIPTLDDLAMLG